MPSNIAGSSDPKEQQLDKAFNALDADASRTFGNVMLFQTMWNVSGRPVITQDGVWAQDTANAMATLNPGGSYPVPAVPAALPGDIYTDPAGRTYSRGNETDQQKYNDLVQAFNALKGDPSHSYTLVFAFQKAWNASGESPHLVEDGVWGSSTGTLHATRDAFNKMNGTAASPPPAPPTPAPLPPPSTPYVPAPPPPPSPPPPPPPPQRVEAGQGWLAVGILAGILGIGWLTSKKRTAGQP